MTTPARTLLFRLFPLALALCGPATGAAQAPGAGTPGTTTVVVVRHAEKAADHPQDPSLSPAGQARAEALRAALEHAGVSALYVTQYRRTRLTAAPLAQRLGLAPTERPVSSASATFAQDLRREILARHAGGTVLVVGHSNTVPQIVQELSGQPVAPITDSEYDHLFVVVVPQTGAARLLRVRYGP